MKRFLTILCIIFIVIFILTKMSEAQKSPQHWPKSVTIGAAPLGGTYYIWVGGFIKLLQDKMGIPGYMVITGGPIHNTMLTDANKLDFGMVTATPLWEGWQGEAWAKGKKHQNSRAIFPMYASYFQMYSLKKSGIKSIYDLNGKRVGVGPIGGTPATYWPKILEMAGVKPGRIVNAESVHLNLQLVYETIDANSQAVGLPWMIITETEATHEINILSIPKTDAEKFVAKNPHFSPGVIPKGYYKSNKDYDIETITVWNFMIVHREAADDFVYEVVKKTFENVDILIATHPSAKETKPEYIVNSPIPLHPGALRYYKEKGIKIPEKLILP
ncbi:MAG: TAXI family TRAP transporter solute-binding subunit [Thermodesulfobacteriota bacterium]|nr:TAXI family TRAP transporter solute-binding subunit [Thermodesulfobacteriota bacterium]